MINNALHDTVMGALHGQPSRPSYRRKFMVLHTAASGVFVKEYDFFRQQNGHRKPWGRKWRCVVATSIEQARACGAKLPVVG